MSKATWYIILTSQKSSWVSTQKIAFNLLSAYQTLKNEVNIETLSFDRETEFDDIQEIVKRVVDAKPEKIIFLDHQPHPINLLKGLHRSLPLSWEGEMVFHVYGDFTLNYRFWHLSESFLHERKVRFFAASHKQKWLLEKFIDSKYIQICPFPTIKERYYYNPELRKKERQKYGLTESDFLWTYTGRLSRQKNIIETIDIFAEALKENSKLHFFLAGKDDNINAPYFNLHSEPGEYFFRIQQKLNTLDEFTRSRIKLLGPIDEKDLLALYNAADAFVSLSLYNDEDFGMSCVEAFFTGLPGLITDWGGYASFWLSKEKNQILLCPTNIGEYEVSFERPLAIKQFKQISQEKKNQDHRQDASQSYMDSFSVESIGLHLSLLYREKSHEFISFHAFLNEVVQRSMQESYIYLEPDSHKISSIYRKIYESYSRNTFEPFNK